MSELRFPTRYPRMEQPPQRPKEMKVLALGLSRTGTMSLYVALQKLGYNSYHMVECLLDAANDSLVLWHEAIDAKFNSKGRRYVGEDFDKMLWRYDAVTDIPCVLFVDELLEAYPDAKIILTGRPVDAWARSVDASFYEVLSWKRWWFLCLFDRRVAYHYFAILKSALTAWTGTHWQDKSRLPEGYVAHYMKVLQAAETQGREVLQFRFQDGWKPLCQFLDAPIPEEPYPHVNEGIFTANLHFGFFRHRVTAVLQNFLKSTVPILVAGAGWWWLHSW